MRFDVVLLALKAVYLGVYWLEAILTVVLIRRHGVFYEGNPVARRLAARFGPNSLFLFPLVIGSFWVTLLDYSIVFVIFILFHSVFLLDHIHSLKNADQIKRDIFAGMELARANERSELKVMIASIIVTPTILIGMLAAYHYFHVLR